MPSRELVLGGSHSGYTMRSQPLLCGRVWSSRANSVPSRHNHRRRYGREYTRRLRSSTGWRVDQDTWLVNSRSCSQRRCGRWLRQLLRWGYRYGAQHSQVLFSRSLLRCRISNSLPCRLVLCRSRTKSSFHRRKRGRVSYTDVWEVCSRTLVPGERNDPNSSFINWKHNAGPRWSVL